jgi:hypothetical protein
MYKFYQFLEVLRRYWLQILLCFFAMNLLMINAYLLFFDSSSAAVQKIVEVNKSSFSDNSCPQACTDQIDIAFDSQNISSESASLSGRPVAPTKTPTPGPTTTPTNTPTPGPSVKEFFVPLGMGSGKSSDWEVMDGLEAQINPSDYGDVKEVTFEVVARIPTGNQQIWIRLYNSSTFQDVSGSEVSHSGGATELLVSSPFNFASGENLYKIQMKTQLQFTANIDMARLRIKVN